MKTLIPAIASMLAACSSASAPPEAPTAKPQEPRVLEILRKAPERQEGVWFLTANFAGWQEMLKQNWGHALPLGFQAPPRGAYTRILLVQDLGERNDRPFYVKEGIWKGEALVDGLAKSGFTKIGRGGAFTVLRSGEQRMTIAATDHVAMGDEPAQVERALKLPSDGQGSIGDVEPLRRLLAEVGDGDMIVGSWRGKAAKVRRGLEAVVGCLTMAEQGDSEFTLIASCDKEEDARSVEEELRSHFREEAVVARSILEGRCRVIAKGHTKKLSNVTDLASRLFKPSNR